MKNIQTVFVILALAYGVFAFGESCPYENEKGYIPSDLGLQLIKDLREKKKTVSLNGTKMTVLQMTQVTSWGELDSVNAVKHIRTIKRIDGTTACKYNLEKTIEFSSGMGSFKFEVLLSPDASEPGNANPVAYKEWIAVSKDGSWKAF